VFAGSQLAYGRRVAAVAVAVADTGSEADAECVVEAALKLAVVEAAVEPAVADCDGGAAHGSADLLLAAVSSPGLALNAHMTAYGLASEYLAP
jgi:hypothetical protein